LSLSKLASTLVKWGFDKLNRRFKLLIIVFPMI